MGDKLDELLGAECFNSSGDRIVAEISGHVDQVAVLSLVELVVSFFALLAGMARMLERNNYFSFANLVEAIALVADIALGVISVAVFTVPALNKFEDLKQSMDGSMDVGASEIVPCMATCKGSLVTNNLGITGDPPEPPW